MHNSGNDCESACSYPRRQTIHDVCNRVGLSYGSRQCIPADELNMRQIAAKFVPRLLNNDQRDHWVQVLTLTPAYFNQCFQKRQNHWDHCMQVQGDYFEGDGQN
jgi:hypothetical protein